MLSKEDSRRLAQLERQLRRDDPDFCTRMAGGRTSRRRAPIALILTATVVWTTAVILAVVGWWGAAAVAGVWGSVIAVAVIFRSRPPRRIAPDTLPPAW